MRYVQVQYRCIYSHHEICCSQRRPLLLILNFTYHREGLCRSHRLFLNLGLQDASSQIVPHPLHQQTLHNFIQKPRSQSISTSAILTFAPRIFLLLFQESMSSSDPPSLDFICQNRRDKHASRPHLSPTSAFRSWHLEIRLQKNPAGRLASSSLHLRQVSILPSSTRIP